jgi:hypothetical protein
MTYDTDCWVIVELSGKKVPKKYHRVLAGFYGSYLSNDAWQMSSGITKIVDMITYWEIHNISGSIYNCNKKTERFNNYTKGIFDSYVEGNTEDVGMTRVDFESIRSLYEQTIEETG